MAYRNAPMGFNWPDNWKEVPTLERVDETTAYFEDGTSKKVDAIILCTGYKHHFPFLPDDLRLKTANRLATADLYKGVAWVHNPKLFYLGMQDQWFTFNMFDAQAWWVRDAIMGRIAIPADKAVLLKDVADRVAGEDAGKDAHDAIHYQGDYVKELIAETDYPVLRRRWRLRGLLRVEGPQEGGHHGLPQPCLPVGHHRHDGAGPPHALEGRAGGFDGKLSEELSAVATVGKRSGCFERRVAVHRVACWPDRACGLSCWRGSSRR